MHEANSLLCSPHVIYCLTAKSTDTIIIRRSPLIYKVSSSIHCLVYCCCTMFYAFQFQRM
jgi:hypothetical protein